MKRRLKEWKITVRKKPADSSELRDRITNLYFNGLVKKDLLKILQQEGFDIRDRTLRRIHTEMELLRRARTTKAQEEAN